MNVAIVTNLGGPHKAHAYIIDVFSNFGNVDIIKVGRSNVLQTMYYIKKHKYDIVFFEDITLSKFLNFLDLNCSTMGVSADRLVFASIYKPKWYLKDGLIIKSTFPLHYYKYLDYFLVSNGIRRLNCVFAVSPLMFSVIKNYNKNIYIIRPVPTLQRYYKNKITYLDYKDNRLILSISRGGSFKGLDLLLRSFILSKEKNKNLKLILLGNLVELNKFRDLVSYVKRKYEKDIKIITEYVPHSELVEYYKVSTIYLQTSYFDPCPVSVLDSIIFENIPIVTELVGSKDFISNEFISKVNPRDISNKILFATNLSNNEKRKYIKRMKRKVPTAFYENQKRLFKHILKNILQIDR